jgi:hypothetical protein
VFQGNFCLFAFLQHCAVLCVQGVRLVPFLLDLKQYRLRNDFRNLESLASLTSTTGARPLRAHRRTISSSGSERNSRNFYMPLL